MTKYGNYFIKLAVLTAQLSKDPNTKVGSVIVTRNNTQISIGYNGFPKGIVETTERWEKPVKYDYVIHSELNAIINCPFDTIGATLYCTHHPCTECLKAIINAGISHLCYIERPEWESNYVTSVSKELRHKFITIQKMSLKNVEKL